MNARKRWQGRGGAAALAVLAALATPGWARAQEDTRETARLSLEKWIETRRLISRETQDWRLGRELLEDRVDIVGREIESLREKTAQAERDTSEADVKVAEAQAQNRGLQDATAGLGEAVTKLEARVRALLARCPAPLVERVKPLSQRMPQNPAESKATFSERFQNVIGILNEVNKASREIAVVSDLRDLPGGGNAEVTAIYLGLGQAYYCNEKSGLAGTGRSSAQGWVWEPRNEIAPAVAQIIGIYRNERPAGYVRIPVEVE